MKRIEFNLLNLDSQEANFHLIQKWVFTRPQELTTYTQ